METWPGTPHLPDIGRQLDITQISSLARSTAAGNIDQRARFDVEVQRHNVRFVMSDFEYGFFRAFMKHKISNGADWFLIHLAFKEVTESVAARFVDATYKAEHDNGFWQVSATLEVENVPTAA